MIHRALSTPLIEVADRIADSVRNLNGLMSSIINEEVTASDFNNDLTALLDKLAQVEMAVSELTDVFWEQPSGKESG